MTLDMKIVISAFFLLACNIHAGVSLECYPPNIRVSVKIPDISEFDDYEQYLFQGVVAYSVRKYCGSISPSSCLSSTSNLNNTDTSDVTIFNQTDRFAMCVRVENCAAELLQDAIRESKPRFNGALVLTDSTLEIDGIPIILTPKIEPDFPTWLIPFIVITCLVLIAAIAIVSYTVYQSKKESKIDLADCDDEETLSHIYENPTAPTVTEM